MIEGLSTRLTKDRGSDVNKNTWKRRRGWSSKADADRDISFTCLLDLVWRRQTWTSRDVLDPFSSLQRPDGGVVEHRGLAARSARFMEPAVVASLHNSVGLLLRHCRL